MSDAVGRHFHREKHYIRLALETKRLLFPSTHQHPWSTAQDGGEKGSAAIIEFSGSQKPVVHKAQNAEDLRAWLNRPRPATSSSASATNRLIILEDLDQRYVNVVGAHIRVPPVVFLAHAAGPYVDDIVDEDCLAHNDDQYWRIKTFQLHKVDPHPEQAFGVYVGKDTVLNRNMQYLDRDRAFHPSAHLVSFWSTSDSDSSWTALLLVDPVLRNVIHKLHMTPPSDQPVHNITLQHSDLGDDRVPIPARFSLKRLPEDPQQWESPPERPLSLSFFDNLLHAYTYHEHTATDPRSATDVIRKLILSSWQGMIRAKELDYHHFWGEISLSKARYASGSSWYSAWDSRWRRECFHALTYHMMTVMNRMRDIDDIFRTLYPTTTTTTTTSASSTTTSRPPDDSHTTHHHDNTRSRETPSWHALRARAHALHARFAATLATYEQRASIEQSLLANGQARSVGRLTALATTLVPFSVVAGVFSMSGRFAADGGDLFWVFWTVAVAVSGALVGWLFCFGGGVGEAVVGVRVAWSERGWGAMMRTEKGEGEGDEGAVLPVHEKDT